MDGNIDEHKVKSLTPNELETINKFQAQNTTPILNEKKAQQELEHLYNDGERGELFRTHIHKVAIWFIYTVGCLLILMIIIRGWHLMVCDKLQWLDETQLHDIERVIFTGLILSFAGDYFKKYINLDKKK